LRAAFGEDIAMHPLRREIIATHVLNSMVNRVGPTFVHQLAELTGATASQVVKAYLLSREVFASVELWQGIEALDDRVANEVQSQMLIEWRQLIARATTWFLRSRHLDEPAGEGARRLAPAVSSLRLRLEPEAAGSPQVAAWVQAGVPASLARQVGAADRLFNALDIAEVAEAGHCELEVTSEVHFGIGERLGLERLRQQIELLPAESHWDSLAQVALADDLADLQRSITLDAARGNPGSAQQKLASWEERKPAALARAKRLVAELAEAPSPELAMLSVALRELRKLA
jgi:glutamate dehydrogenase